MFSIIAYWFHFHLKMRTINQIETVKVQEYKSTHSDLIEYKFVSERYLFHDCITFSTININPLWMAFLCCFCCISNIFLFSSFWPKNLFCSRLIFFFFLHQKPSQILLGSINNNTRRALCSCTYLIESYDFRAFHSV